MSDLINQLTQAAKQQYIEISEIADLSDIHTQAAKELKRLERELQRSANQYNQDSEEILALRKEVKTLTTAVQIALVRLCSAQHSLNGREEMLPLINNAADTLRNVIHPKSPDPLYPILERMWFNQPSKIQEHHHLNQTNVLAGLPNDRGIREVYFLTGDVTRARYPSSALAKGWI